MVETKQLTCTCYGRRCAGCECGAQTRCRTVRHLHWRLSRPPPWRRPAVDRSGTSWRSWPCEPEGCWDLCNHPCEGRVWGRRAACQDQTHCTHHTGRGCSLKPTGFSMWFYKYKWMFILNLLLYHKIIQILNLYLKVLKLFKIIIMNWKFWQNFIRIFPTQTLNVGHNDSDNDTTITIRIPDISPSKSFITKPLDQYTGYFTTTRKKVSITPKHASLISMNRTIRVLFSHRLQPVCFYLEIDQFCWCSSLTSQAQYDRRTLITWGPWLGVSVVNDNAINRGSKGGGEFGDVDGSGQQRIQRSLP